jgi:hypothetical protein
MQKKLNIFILLTALAVAVVSWPTAAIAQDVNDVNFAEDPNLHQTNAKFHRLKIHSLILSIPNSLTLPIRGPPTCTSSLHKPEPFCSEITVV